MKVILYFELAVKGTDYLAFICLNWLQLKCSAVGAELAVL